MPILQTNGVNGTDHTDSHDGGEVDVLIIGAGPAGLVAAYWMARLGIKTRIVDKRGTRVYNGQADGLQCRTMEILDSMGIANKVTEVAQQYHDVVIWEPGKQGTIEPREKVFMAYTGLSRFVQTVLNQGYIERFLLESISEHSDIAVERGVLPTSLSIDESKADDPDAYPVTVHLQHLTEEEATPQQCKAHTKSGEVQDGLYRSNLSGDDTDELINRAAARGGTEEVIRAKYVIGSDGAHSWTRHQLGFEMVGDTSDYIWGALDIIPITNFPEIRRPCVIQSMHGSMLIIPREKRLVRLYIQLSEVKPGESGVVDRNAITPDAILAQARKILAPYTMDYAYCDWWTAYQIGQRVGNRFSDSTGRVFLAGDAVHTHSPKAGQGMNVSMQDSYNLGWKLGGVVKGWYKRDEMMKTYEYERKSLAHKLIDFDRQLGKVFSGRPSPEVLREMYRQNLVFMAGFAVHYAPSLITASETGTDDAASNHGTNGVNGSAPNGSTNGSYTNGHNTDEAKANDDKDKHHAPLPPNSSTPSTHHARNLTLGKVLPNYRVLLHSDSYPMDLQRALRSDGRWRLLVFAGDVSQPPQLAHVNSLGGAIQHLVDRYMPSNPPPALHNATEAEATKRDNCLIDVLTVHSSHPHALSVLDFHEALVPCDEVMGYDYRKVFADCKAAEGMRTGDAYEGYGIDKQKGAFVAVRPDQYVAFIAGLDQEGLRDVEKFFEGVLTAR